MLDFDMLAPGSGNAAPATTEVHDYSGGRATATARWLAAYFGGTVVTEPAGTGPAAGPATPPLGETAAPPSPGASPGTADIVVVLGLDFSSGFDNEELPVTGPPPPPSPAASP